jgi:hypothetical protein
MVTFFRIILVLFPLSGFTWNAKGHALITALALSKLSPQTQQSLLSLANSGHVKDRKNLLEISIWLDKFYNPKFRHLRKIHYIDIPFGKKKYFPKQISRYNALSALRYSYLVLHGRYESRLDKAFAMRVLMHVIADIHQPLHTISFYAKRFPHGDKGGNLYRIRLGRRHMNLHHFWDDAGGLLSTYSLDRIYMDLKNKPCSPLDQAFSPEQWVKQSHDLATKYAYVPPYQQNKMHRYQIQTQEIAISQIQSAACHLAATLNHLDIRGLEVIA